MYDSALDKALDRVFAAEGYENDYRVDPAPGGSTKVYRAAPGRHDIVWVLVAHVNLDGEVRMVSCR